MAIAQLNIFKQQGKFKKVIEIISNLDDITRLELQILRIESLIGLNNYEFALEEINSLINKKGVVKKTNLIS